MNGYTRARSRLYPRGFSPSLEEFESLCSQQTKHSDYPNADSIISNIPVYDLSKHLRSESNKTESLQDEWYDILHSGPGVLVLRHFFTDMNLIETVNGVFNDIIARDVGTAKGDHFAASGKNSRIWNSFQKHAEKDSASFVAYYSNPWLGFVSEAWLGPAYQVTAQVNLVRPGGQPQVAHRDYHLGFQSADSCARFPRTMQTASQLLTLQGAIAHSDMPLESGPTRFLPFSQQFEAGYMAYRLPEFTEFFNKHWVSAPLEIGDAVFFNPALFHAAGENTSKNIQRSANLLQISSALGKSMEAVDNVKILESVWGDLKNKADSEGYSEEVEACAKAIASGYPFPTNLDRRPPAPGGMAPESKFDIVSRGLKEGWKSSQIVGAIKALRSESCS